MGIKHKLVVGAAGLLVVGGVGTGIAYAQAGPGPSGTGSPAVTGTTGDPQHVAQADDGPDQPGDKEQSGEVESTSDADGGHQDPDGVNVQFTPAGEQPER